jgi:aminoglycoside phosphotransferase (APT) family kinase protein
MTALEVRLADGQTRKLIVRQPGARAIRHNADAAADEFTILQIVQSAGVKTQTPYILDESGEIFPEPYLVVEYIEGNPEFAPTNITACVEQMATQLAALHRIKSSTLDSSCLARLPNQAQRLQRTIQQQPVTLDHSLDEGRIRSVLEAVWPLPVLHEAVLLHGDFWPGNLLWKDGKLVAVIDWEDAEVGNPFVDLAISRLDVLWIYGLDAMQFFTQRYQTLTTTDSGLDFSYLPFWDLFAALRPASRIAEWAAGWPELGRSDITETTMRAKHHWFVAQAFENLPVR